MTCKDTCPVVIKNSLLGCNSRPVAYQKECPRLKEFKKHKKKEE